MKAWNQCTALVTGGQGAIGRALVSELRARGATVYSTSRCGNSSDVLSWDMSDPEASNQLIDELKGRKLSIDMMVHCAHVFSDSKLIFQVPVSDFQSSLITNLVPLYELMRYLVRPMYRQKFGRMLLMGSLIQSFGGSGKISYIVEKSAFNGLAKGFSAEFQDSGVSTSVVHPSIVDTDNIRERVNPEIIQRMAQASHGGRLLQMPELVAACMPLLDPMIAVKSGQLIDVTGGASW